MVRIERIRGTGNMAPRGSAQGRDRLRCTARQHHGMRAHAVRSGAGATAIAAGTVSGQVSVNGPSMRGMHRVRARVGRRMHARAAMRRARAGRHPRPRQRERETEREDQTHRAHMLMLAQLRRAWQLGAARVMAPARAAPRRPFRRLSGAFSRCRRALPARGGCAPTRDTSRACASNRSLRSRPKPIWRVI